MEKKLIFGILAIFAVVLLSGCIEEKPLANNTITDNTVTGNENVSMDFSSEPCSEDVDAYDPSIPKVIEKNWEDNSTLKVRAYVRTNCAEDVLNGDFKIEENKITLVYEASDCMETEMGCAECDCVHEINYTFSNIAKKEYEFEIEKSYEPANENVRMDFYAEPCDQDINPYDESIPRVLETNWANNSTLEVMVRVAINCAESILSGDFEIEGNKIILSYESTYCGDNEEGCTLCNCAHDLIYTFTNIAKKEYEFEISEIS
ncbi:MAG: hypothetical protein V1672_04490 [Candidatus Diapherotrites archaeon]